MVLTSEDTSWFWTEEWQAKEREADEDYKNGRYDTVNTIDELITLLHKHRSNNPIPSHKEFG